MCFPCGCVGEIGDLGGKAVWVGQELLCVYGEGGVGGWFYILVGTKCLIPMRKNAFAMPDSAHVGM